MKNEEVIVERLDYYSGQDMEDLGKLMHYLSDKFDGSPINHHIIEEIIESPYHDQLVARIEGRIVGAATMSIIMGVGAGKKGYLNDFVTDPEFQKRGIGSKLWDEMVNWCNEFGVDLEFTSNPSRAEAHDFYESHGAKVRDTDVFHVDLKDPVD